MKKTRDQILKLGLAFIIKLPKKMRLLSQPDIFKLVLNCHQSVAKLFANIHQAVNKMLLGYHKTAFKLSLTAAS